MTPTGAPWCRSTRLIARRTDLRYVVTAVGRDYGDVAPTSGTYVSRHGKGKLAVRKRIRLADVA